jgi:hypothetical protein
MRRTAVRLFILAIAGVVVLGAALIGAFGVTASSAARSAGLESSAAPAFKYWGYYHGVGAGWEYSMDGPDQYVPDDGDVEGWRYGLDTGGKRPPRTVPDFDTICGGQPADPRSKRVAVVIDYGIQEEAEGNDETPPARGACARVPKDASGQDVLEAVADLTFGEGSVAAIDGYPSVPSTDTFDSAEIPESEPTVDLFAPLVTPDPMESEAAADDGDDDGPPWGLIGVGVVVVVIAGGAYVVVRRRG